ncbi:unnamed protein product [Rotaria socialis]
MHISIAKFGGSENVLTVEIASDLSLKDLKAVIEAESDFAIKAEEMSLYFEGKLLGDDNQTLAQCKFNDYDLLTCQRASGILFSICFGRMYSDKMSPNLIMV